jgi:hypothetical protein
MKENEERKLKYQLESGGGGEDEEIESVGGESGESQQWRNENGEMKMKHEIEILKMSG